MQVSTPPIWVDGHVDDDRDEDEVTPQNYDIDDYRNDEDDEWDEEDDED